MINSLKQIRAFFKYVVVCYVMEINQFQVHTNNVYKKKFATDFQFLLPQLIYHQKLGFGNFMTFSFRVPEKGGLGVGFCVCVLLNFFTNSCLTNMPVIVKENYTQSLKQHMHLLCYVHFHNGKIYNHFLKSIMVRCRNPWKDTVANYDI